jgi:hypothetical protein
MEGLPLRFFALLVMALSTCCDIQARLFNGVLDSTLIPVNSPASGAFILSDSSRDNHTSTAQSPSVLVINELVLPELDDSELDSSVSTPEVLTDVHLSADDRWDSDSKNYESSAIVRQPDKLVADNDTELKSHKSKPIACSSLISGDENAICWYGRFSFDLLHANYNQYARYSTSDFDNRLHGDSGFLLSGYAQIGVNASSGHSEFHSGFIYYLAHNYAEVVADNVQVNMGEPVGLLVEEAYLSFVPFDSFPIFFRIGKSYTPFGSSALVFPQEGQDYPVYASNTFLLTQTRRPMGAITYDDEDGSGITASVYAQVRPIPNDTEGDLQAWGVSLGFKRPTLTANGFGFGINLNTVSDPEGVLYLSDFNLPERHRAYAGLGFVMFKRLSIEYALARLKIDENTTLRAWDYNISYLLAAIEHVGNSNLFFGWGKSYGAVAYDLPESSWWLGVRQSVDRAIELSLLTIHTSAYETSAALGKTDKKITLRISYAF